MTPEGESHFPLGSEWLMGSHAAVDASHTETYIGSTNWVQKVINNEAKNMKLGGWEWRTLEGGGGRCVWSKCIVWTCQGINKTTIKKKLREIGNAGKGKTHLQVLNMQTAWLLRRLKQSETHIQDQENPSKLKCLFYLSTVKHQNDSYCLLSILPSFLFCSFLFGRWGGEWENRSKIAHIVNLTF